MAEFLIKRIQSAAINMYELQEAIITSTNRKITEESVSLNTFATHFSYLTKDYTKDQLNKISVFTERLKSLTKKVIVDEKHRLTNQEQFLKLISPENILKKGYTLTIRDNKIVKNSAELKEGDTITNRFFDGDVISIVK